MPMSSVLRVGRTASGYRFRLEGEAALRGHLALFELFVVQLLDRTAGSVVVDLSDCTRVDDRFLDMLFDLGRLYAGAGARRFTIATQSPREAAGADEIELPGLELGGADIERHLAGWHRLLGLLAGPRRDAVLACR